MYWKIVIIHNRVRSTFNPNKKDRIEIIYDRPYNELEFQYILKCEIERAGKRTEIHELLSKHVESFRSFTSMTFCKEYLIYQYKCRYYLHLLFNNFYSIVDMEVRRAFYNLWLELDNEIQNNS